MDSRDSCNENTPPVIKEAAEGMVGNLLPNKLIINELSTQFLIILVKTKSLDNVKLIMVAEKM